MRGKRTVTVLFSKRSPRVVPVQVVLNGTTVPTGVQPKLSMPTVVGMKIAGTPRGAVFVGPVAVTLKVMPTASFVNVPVAVPVTVQTAPTRVVQGTPAWPVMTGGL